jgi:hypothetical protein
VAIAELKVWRRAALDENGKGQGNFRCGFAARPKNAEDLSEACVKINCVAEVNRFITLGVKFMERPAVAEVAEVQPTKKLEAGNVSARR